MIFKQVLKFQEFEKGLGIGFASDWMIDIINYIQQKEMNMTHQKQIITNRSKHNTEFKRQYFDRVLENIDASSSFRDTFKMAVLFYQDKTLTNNHIELLKTKLKEVINASNTDLQVIESPNDEQVRLFEAKGDILLGEIGERLKKGQIERFVDDNFNPDSLGFFIDQMDNPGRYIKGFVKKSIVTLSVNLMKKLGNDLYFESMLDAGGMKWRDDGEVNPEFNLYLVSNGKMEGDGQKNKPKFSARM